MHTITPLIIGNGPTLTNWAFWQSRLSILRKVTISSLLPINAGSSVAHVELYFEVSSQLWKLAQFRNSNLGPFDLESSALSPGLRIPHCWVCTIHYKLMVFFMKQLMIFAILNILRIVIILKRMWQPRKIMQLWWRFCQLHAGEDNC